MFWRKQHCPLDEKGQHIWSTWTDPEEITARTSFNSQSVLIQKRTCLKCNFVEAREIAKASARA